MQPYQVRYTAANEDKWFIKEGSENRLIVKNTEGTAEVHIHD